MLSGWFCGSVDLLKPSNKFVAPDKIPKDMSDSGGTWHQKTLEIKVKGFGLKFNALGFRVYQQMAGGPRQLRCWASVVHIRPSRPDSGLGY